MNQLAYLLFRDLSEFQGLRGSSLGDSTSLTIWSL